MLLMKSGAGSGALTQVTEAAQHVTISIPAGKGGVLKAVYLQTCTVEETLVNSGGLARLWNTSADWDPFYLLSGQGSIVTEGGMNKAPVCYDVEKELPGNSVVYVNYTPYDNQSQRLYCTLVWELGGKPRKETFSGYIHPLKAAAVTAAATRASPGNYAIPGGKGGRIYKIAHMAYGTLETVVQDGGLAELENNAFDMTPCHFYPSANTAVGASGGAHKKPDQIPYDAPCPQNSTFTTYYTPTDDQSQTLSTLILWERPIRRTVA